MRFPYQSLSEVQRILEIEDPFIYLTRMKINEEIYYSTILFT